MKTFGFEVFLKKLIVHCKAFEYNSKAIYLVLIPKIRPHKKYINAVFCHFYEYLHKGLIHILKVSMYDQCDDACTKPLPHNIFLKIVKLVFVSTL